MSFVNIARTAGRRAFKAVKTPINLLRFRRYYKAATPVDLEKVREFRNEAFPKSEPACWLDRPDAADAIAARLRAGTIDAAEAEALRFWVKNGYLVIPGLIDPSTLDMTWRDYEAALASGALGERTFVDDAKTLADRKLDPHLTVPSIRALQHHPAVLRWTDLLFGRKTIPFQTIMGHAGSQQRAHSDSIHMTTYPLGYLVANWIAFEDIDPKSGPLEYYPGSHRLPYLLSAEVGIAEHEYKDKGAAVYHERYEPAIQHECEKAGFQREVFLAKKGNVLFWHANLVHGGTPREDSTLSRKALVCHFFAEGAVTYHDLSGNASRLHKDGMYAPMTV